MNYLAKTVLALTLAGCSLIDNDIPASKVPSVVKNAFAKEFSNPLDVEWEKKKKNYEVDFEMEEVDYSARFNPDGQLLMYKQDIGSADLPTAVTGRIAEEFPDRTFDDAEKVVKGSSTYYQVELDGQPRDTKAVYTSDGLQDKSIGYWD